MQLCTVDLQTYQQMGQWLLWMEFHLEREPSIPVILDLSYEVLNSVPARETENGPQKLPFANVGEKVCSAGHSFADQVPHCIVLYIVWSHNQYECVFYAIVILPHTYIHHVCKHAAKPVECDDLGAPYKGQVVLGGRSPGSKATYSCSPGYQLVGSSTRICQNNGQWSGSTPFCRSKNSISTRILLTVEFVQLYLWSTYSFLQLYL